VKIVRVSKVAGKSVWVDDRRLTLAKAPKDFPYERLNPLQTAFHRTYEGGKALVIAPTSSGKTGVGMLFLRGRGVYATPTKALAREIYSHFVSVYGEENVGLKMGDVFDEYEEEPKSLYVSTYESLVNALRTSKEWVSKPVVLDEVHHIYKDRGVVIEELLAHLNLRGWDYLALSATVPDPEALAEVVGANYLLISDYRPVPIHEEYERVSGRGDEGLAETLLRKLMNLSNDEQVIVFVYKKDIGYRLLKKLHDQGYGILNETLPFVSKRRGEDVAFHNADVPAVERERIETSFREGRLRWLIATQTLAYGVNLPADRVMILVRKIKDRRTGKVKFLPDSLDILQMKGRAGRHGIKERGFVNVLVITRSKNPMEEILRDLTGKRPYVEELRDMGISLHEYWGVSSQIALMIMGAVASELDWRKFLGEIPSLKGAHIGVFEEVYSYLMGEGYISEEGKLTRLGEVMLKNAISPLAYDEFRRRADSNVEPLLTARPLMYMKRLKGSLRSFLPPEDYYMEVAAFKSKYYTTITLNDGSDELWIFVSGRLYEYPNISNPPGELAFSRSDLFHLARVVVALHREGYIFTTVEGILRLMHSYRYGLPYEFAPLGGIEGVGFVRANALYRALEMLNIHRVDFGPYEFPYEMFHLLMEVFSERYDSRDMVEREARTTVSLLQDSRFLCDVELLKLLAFAIMGKEAIEHMGRSPEELMETLKGRL